MVTRERSGSIHSNHIICGAAAADNIRNVVIYREGKNDSMFIIRIGDPVARGNDTDTSFILTWFCVQKWKQGFIFSSFYGLLDMDSCLHLNYNLIDGEKNNKTSHVIRLYVTMYLHIVTHVLEMVILAYK